MFSPQGKGTRALLSLALVALLAGVFWWFRAHDVWDVQAEFSPARMIVWSMLRFVFLLCLGSACLTTGGIVLAARRQQLEELGTLERLLFCFFTGGAVLRLGMFALGLAGGYSPGMGLFVMLPLVALFPFVFDLGGMARDGWSAFRENVLQSFLCLIPAGAAAAMLGFVYFGHCQYSLDGDYLTHYGPYYEAVIRGGGLAPNDVWYQFFYSKGAGLFYLGMLLTDHTGPLLVSFLHFVAAILLMYVVMRRAGGGVLWALSSAVFLLGMTAWPYDGFFIKHHCEISAVIFSITACAVLMSAAPRIRSLCWIALVVSQAGLMVYSLQSGAYTMVFIGVCALWALWRREPGLFLRYAVVLVAAGAASVLVMLYNHAVTGLYEITPFRVFLPFWNQETFSRWVSPYLMFYLSEGSSADLGTIGITGMLQNVVMYAKLFRLEKFFFARWFWALSFLTVGLAVWSRLGGDLGRGAFGLRLSLKSGAPVPVPGQDCMLRVPYSDREFVASAVDRQEADAVRGRMLRLVLIPSFGMCLLVFLVYLLVNQPVSILRLSEFASIYVTLFIFSVFVICHSMIREALPNRLVGVLIPILIALTAFSWTAQNSRNSRVTKPLKFAAGLIAPNALASDDPAVGEACPLIREAAGREGRIASLNLSVEYGSLFLQHPGLMTEISYAFGNRWHELVFSPPAEARKAFQDLGVNHFLVNLDAPFFGVLPFSPLFSEESLRANFRIVWCAESRYLLTWNDQGQGLPEFFLGEWKENLQRAMPSVIKKGGSNYGQALYDRMRELYELNHHAQHGIVRPAGMKRVEGWQ